jgi:gamma-glutamylcyclotransferase (GGCT)/AIG2-like uncharacterized protein YtfP
MNSRLFVYGTLLSTAGHPMGARLRREGRLLGQGTIQGRLYSIGRYPGLVEAPGSPRPAQSLAHGELYALNTPAVTFKWLDAYEGLVPGKPELSPYERVERPVRLGSGETLTAWVYLYRKSVRARPEVLGGFWVPPAL